MLELDQIQGTVLRNRPMPYVGAYLLFRIDDVGHARTLLRALLPHVTSAADWQDPVDDAWINVVFTHEGLARIGVARGILDGFPREFREPMSTRKEFLGDVGESDPARWDMPDAAVFHIGLLLMAADRAGFDRKMAIGDTALAGLSGVRLVDRIDIATPENHREHFGYVDGLSRPFIEGQGGSPAPGQGDPARAGKFVLGYVNELGTVAIGPGPEGYWRNGTYISIRKMHQKVALFRRFLAAHESDPGGAELLAAKMVGRWRSGCPVELSPDRDDPEIAADPLRNNDFSYGDDPRGVRTPLGAHVRRVNPRDALDGTGTDTRLHRILRRGAAYGPMLPEGVLDDDGANRGLMLSFVNADPGRQFEFILSQWVNDGDFISAGHTKDPLAGNHGGRGDFVYPARPVRRHLTDLPSFAVTRGGAHVFLPGIRGLEGLAEGRWS